MLSLFSNNIFILMALWACLLASFASGIIGSFVVIKRISFIAGSIAHSVLAGMGFFLWLNRSYGLTWLDPMWGAFVTAIISALLLGWIHNYKQREDAVIAAIWSTGMAIGMIFLSLTPGTNVELLNYLFGNVLWINSQDLIRLAILNGAVLAIVAIFYRKFLAICFDEEQALLQGIRVKQLYLLLLCLLAVSIVLLMQVMGTILVLAMLTLPPTLASLFTNRLFFMMTLSIFLCACFSTIGLSLATWFNWPPAATIVLLAAMSYLTALPLKKKKNAFLKQAKQNQHHFLLKRILSRSN